LFRPLAAKKKHGSDGIIYRFTDGNERIRTLLSTLANKLQLCAEHLSQTKVGLNKCENTRVVSHLSPRKSPSVDSCQGGFLILPAPGSSSGYPSIVIPHYILAGTFASQG
jgi:hypothetical protein